MSTHINAKQGEIANKILLPGDPLRAKYIAENFLEDAVCYNEVRGMLGFTGLYKGKRVSVQGTGMGIPSISIYVNELINEYGVDTMIRVGTCGALHEDVKIRDVIIAQSASTNSNVNKVRFGDISFSPTADFDLLYKAYDYSKLSGLKAKVKQIFTGTLFYNPKAKEHVNTLLQYGVVAGEMETSELYTLAAQYNKKALTLLTVSDSMVTGEETSAEEREKTFSDMIIMALEII